MFNDYFTNLCYRQCCWNFACYFHVSDTNIIPLRMQKVQKATISGMELPKAFHQITFHYSSSFCRPCKPGYIKFFRRIFPPKVPGLSAGCSNVCRAHKTGLCVTAAVCAMWMISQYCFMISEAILFRVVLYLF